MPRIIPTTAPNRLLIYLIALLTSVVLTACGGENNNDANFTSNIARVSAQTWTTSKAVSLSSVVAPITIQVNGLVTFVNYNGAGTSSYFTVPPTVGTPFTFLLTYDPTLGIFSVSDPGYTRYTGAITGTTVGFGTQSFSFPNVTAGYIDVTGGNQVSSAIGYQSDYITLTSCLGAHTASARVDLSGASVGYFIDNSIPTFAPNFTMFSNGIFSFSVRNSSPGSNCLDSSDIVIGQVTSVTPVISISSIASLSKSILNFGIIETGTTKDLSFSINNIGSETLTGAVTVAAPYSIVSGGSFSIGAGGSNAVNVRLSPTLDGIFTQNITIAGIPLNITGTSVTPPSNAPVITESPSNTPQGIQTTVRGKNFGLGLKPVVTVGGQPADVIAWDPLHADFIVPRIGAGYANVVVCTAICSAGKKMLVLGVAPTIVTDTTSMHTTAGSLLVIDGQNFGAGPTVDVHSFAIIGTTPVSLVSWSDSRVVMRVPIFPKGTYTLKIGTQFGVTSASIRYANVAAIISSIFCDGILSFSLSCPPIDVAITNGTNGLVNLSVTNSSGRWYGLKVEPSGGTSVPGATIGTGLILPVTTILPIGPHGTYQFNNVILPQVGSITFTADATLDFAVAASAFDYLARVVCPLLTLASDVACPPGLPGDLSGSVSFLNDLIAGLVPSRLVGALQKIYLSLGLSPDGAFSPSDFIGAIGDLSDAIQRDPTVFNYLISKGFKSAALTGISQFAQVATLPWSIAVSFWDLGRSIAAPTVATVLVAGR